MLTKFSQAYNNLGLAYKSLENDLIKKMYIEIPREELLKRISIRTENMFQNKCIEEVKKFKKT
mgnify:CR=1 FL=1